MEYVASVYAAALRAVAGVSGAALRPLVEAATKQTGAVTPPSPNGILDAALALPLPIQGALLWRFNKQLDNPNHRRHIAAGIANEIRTLAGLPGPQSSESAARFIQDGIEAFPSLLTRTEVEEILAYFKARPAIRQDTILDHDVSDVVRAPYVFRVATDERLLRVVHEYLGAPPTIVSMDAFWSLPESEKPIGSQIFHRDRDDFRACKLFVYLSDVSAGDGPHIFVRGSHRREAVEQALTAKSLAPSNADAFFSGNGRQVADKIDEVFGPDVLEITGPAGTSFLENTYGFHRGKIPKTGRRCVYQVLYGSVPFPDRVERWKRAKLTALPKECSLSALALHATRLALS